MKSGFVCLMLFLIPAILPIQDLYAESHSVPLQVGWNCLALPEQPVDLFLYSGKHQPHLYLDERVRANISSFANLADPDELGAGVERLKQDLARGRFEQATAEYEDVGGDYLFIAAQV